MRFIFLRVKALANVQPLRQLWLAHTCPPCT